MKLSNIWNDVSKKLPEIGEEVLVRFEQGKTVYVFKSAINQDNDWFIGAPYNSINPGEPILATHWAPLLHFT